MAVSRAARGAITEADQNFTETWENIVPHGNGVIRLNFRGEEEMEMIVGRRKFMLTTEERLITQSRIFDEKDDPFRNGSFRPIVVPDSVSKETNPNALSDDEIRSIFVSSDLAWQEWISTLDSPETLRRMLDLAGDSDISVRRFKQIGARLAEVKPPTRIVQKDQATYEAMSGQGPVGPGPQQSEQRRQGGRSSDYR